MLLEAIRLVYGEPDGVHHSQEARRVRLRSYFLTLRRFEDAAAAKPAGGPISLKLASVKRERERLAALLDVMGLGLRETEKGYALQRIDDPAAEERRQSLKAAGVDVDVIERALAAGGAVDAVLLSETVPLPLPASAWSAGVFKRSVAMRNLAGAILSDRNAALLYYGLASLDSSTLSFLGDNPATVARLYNQHAAVFATCARSLHLREGRLQTPGPAFAERLWESLVDERAARPDRFISNLFGKDDGRVALFYDTVAHLSGAAQLFALGALIGNEERRSDQFRALYAAFSSELKTWRPAERPFMRVAFDATQLLSAITVTHDGALAPPAWRRLWTVVFEDAGAPEEAIALELPDDLVEPLTAASLVELTSAIDVNSRRAHSETVLFAQRAFASADARAAPDILVALRGFARFPTLMLTLERMGLTDPALMARATRHATALSRLDDPAAGSALLAQFQGALAIVERVRFARVVDVKTAAELVDALTGITPVAPAHYGRQMARWIDTRLLAVIAPLTLGAGGQATRERTILMAMAGAVAGEGRAPGEVPARLVRWEDNDYRVDLGTSELRRLEQVRAKQPSNDLDAVLDFARAADTLASGVTTVAALQGALDALQKVEPRLRPPARVGLPAGEPARDPRALVKRALREAGAITNSRDLSRLGRIASPLTESLDLLLSEVLATLAYLPSLGDPGGPPLLADDIVARHDFGSADARLEMRTRLPWRIGEEVSGAGVPWHVGGSLLGLDVALSNLALRQVAEEQVPVAPTLDMNERATLASAVVLTNPRDLSDADLAAIVGAVRASRQRLDAFRADPAGLEPWLAEARVDEWRIRALEWMFAHEPEEAPSLLSLVELYWLSAPAPGAIANLDAFGSAPASLGACLCTEFPAPQSWDRAMGREGAGFLASRFGDLKLRIAESFVDFNLPAALLPGVLAAATSDFFGEAVPVHRDDFVTLTRRAQLIPNSRIEDYVALLTASGPLTPIRNQKMPLH